MQQYHSKRHAPLALTTALGLALGLHGAAAMAQSLPSTPVVAGGSATFSSDTSAVDTVNLGSDRTLVDWSSFNVAQGSALNFNFGAGHNDWIVLNRTTGQAAIDGTLNGCLSNCTGDFGGNIWIYAPGGIVFGPHAVVNTGGLLATTSPLTDTDDFLDGTRSQFNFGASANNAAVTLCGASCTVKGATFTGPGASLNGHGGLMAFAAQVVNQGVNGSSVSDPGGTVLYGAAKAFTLHLAKSPAAGDWDMVDFLVSTTANGSSNASPINIFGQTKAQNIYVGAVTQNGLTSALFKVNADFEATGASLSDGHIVLSAGGDIQNGAARLSNVSPVDVSLGGVSGGVVSGAATRDLILVGDVTATTALDLRSGRNLQQTGAAGAIVTPDLSAAGVNVYINHTNTIGKVSDLTAAGGTFTLTNNASLTLGNISAGTVDLREIAGNLTLTGDIDTGASQTKLVVSDGDIHQTGGGITAGVLWAQAPGDTVINGANHVTSVKAYDSIGHSDTPAAGSFAFTNAQTVSAGEIKALDTSLTTTAGDLNLTGNNGIIAGTRLTLTAAGNITQNVRAITTALLTGSAGGDITLQSANKIGTVDRLSANSISLTDAQDLTVGDIAASTANLNVSYNLPTHSTATGGMTLTGDLTGRDGTSPMSGLTLNARVGYINEERKSGTIVQSGGAVKAATLASSSDQLLLNGTNGIGTLDNVNANTVNVTNAQALTAGNIDAGQLKLTTTAGDLTLAGQISGPNAAQPASTVILEAGAGNITQTGGEIVTNSLQQLKASGDITLAGANKVGELNDITATNLNFLNAGALTVKAIKATNTHLTVNSGNLTLTRNIIGRNGRSAANFVVLTANNGNISQTGGVITAASLRQSYTSGDFTLTQANKVQELNDITATNLDFVNDGALSVKSIKATATHLTARSGDMVLHNNIYGRNGTSAADKVILTALNGNIDQERGKIWARSLQQLFASGYINITQADIAELNDVTAKSFNFNSGGFDSTRSVKVYSLKADEMFLQGYASFFLTRNIAAADGAGKAQKVIIWTQSGDITQTGGVIHAHELDARALNNSGTVTLLPGNDVGP